MKRLLNPVYVCFFLSGAAGLIYEVVWARQLSLFLGITSWANTAVIGAYMLGLAAGSWWFGKYSMRIHRPLRFYAWLELGIAGFAVTTPWLFDWLQAVYAAWAGVAGVAGTAGHLARFCVALAALLLPTFLMGGTLPVLVRGITQNLPQLGAVTGRLYGINTLGATFGAALTGFVLLPRIGVTGSIAIGVALNVVAAVLILMMPRRQSPGTPTFLAEPAEGSSATDPSALAPAQKFILLPAFAVAGFAALLTQLAWIRAMVLVVGGSVYAFTITLTAFLAGIGLGSLVYGMWLSRVQTSGKRFRLASGLAFLTGIFTLLSLSLIARLPEWFLRGYEAGWVQEFGDYQRFMLLLSFMVMIIPTLLMGALFPLLAVLWAGTLQGAARDIGKAYAVNTLGTVLGALLGGLLVLPALGIHYSLVLAGGLYTLVAAGLLFAGQSRRPLMVAAAAAVLVAAVAITPGWNRYQMAMGAYYAPEARLKLLQEQGTLDAPAGERLLYYQEGIDGIVAVIFDGEQKTLAINGRLEASNRSNLPTQIGLGQIPALMHSSPRKAMVVGLGSGITAGSLAMHEEIEQITVLEISPEVVEAAAFFAADNHHVLQNPRVDLVAADARNYALASDETWDLIISQPSDPGISGVSNLFTVDFFRLMKSKLSADGVMAQWFNIYAVSESDVRTVLGDFLSVFHYVTVWNTQTGDLVMVGSDTRNGLDLERVEEAFSNPSLSAELNRAGLATITRLLQQYLVSNESLAAFVAGAGSNTDDHPKIEFSTPRSLFAGDSKALLKAIVWPVDGAKLEVPLQNRIEVTDAALVVHGSSLRITANPQARFSNVDSNWWQTRQIGESGSSADFTVETLAELTWSEGQDLFTLESVEDSYLPGADLRLQVLQGNLSNQDLVAQGSIVRAEDPFALWLGASSGAGLEVALFFACPSTADNYIWFMVRQSTPFQLGQNPALLAASLSRRMQCL